MKGLLIAALFYTDGPTAAFPGPGFAVSLEEDGGREDDDEEEDGAGE